MSDPRSRREFIVDAGRLALGAALAGPLTALTQATVPTKVDWNLLARNLDGTLLMPGSPAYTEATLIRNLRYAKNLPAAVASVKTARDVATSIRFARDHGVPLVTRSGGHSFAGYSTGPGLVIDLNGMTRVTVDPTTGRMRCVGAATNEDVAVAGQPHGRAVAGGQCPTVGIPGFTLGGGLGFYMRQHGLAIDALVETEMVTADGKVVTANRAEHPELFWACRGGGGGNFGINTSFTFQTFVVPAHVTIFSLTWKGDACARAFLAFQELLQEAPDGLGAVAHFAVDAQETGSPTPTLRVFGQVASMSAERTERMFARVEARAKPIERLFRSETFWAAKEWLAEDTGPPNAFAERSRYFPRPLGRSGAEAIVDALSRAPVRTGNGLSVETPFFAWGGAVNRVDPTATAFYHRRDLWLQAVSASWSLEADPEDVQRLREWQDTFYQRMARYGSDRAYQNFVDPRLKDPLRAYYAGNLARLRRIKRAYDPGNVFTFAQSIR